MLNLGELIIASIILYAVVSIISLMYLYSKDRHDFLNKLFNKIKKALTNFFNLSIISTLIKFVAKWA